MAGEKTLSDVMAFFWESYTTPDKNGVRKLAFKDRAELELLYRAGFVDRNHTLEEWVECFEPHRRQDGSYLLSAVDWEDKRRFLPPLKDPRPFDPMELREGSWDVKEFDRVFEEKILSATLIDPEEFQKLIKASHAKALAAGRITVTKALKKALKDFLEQFPSPLRLLQIQFSSSRPSQETASRFASGRSEAQSATEQLKRLLGRN